jgi:hypothetical protein
MIGLDDNELFVLDRAVRRAEGENLPYLNSLNGGDIQQALIYVGAMDSLVRRGLAVHHHLDDRRRTIVPTKLGRIMRRVETLIRNPSGVTQR